MGKRLQRIFLEHSKNFFGETLNEIFKIFFQYFFSSLFLTFGTKFFQKGFRMMSSFTWSEEI